MSRQLKRVPLTFDWPLHQVWNGYMNPYATSADCPDCVNGYDRAGGRPNANAALFRAQWYGNAPFDPAAYGAAPISPNDPAIWDLARWNVDRAPDFYKASINREAAIRREANRLYEQCFRGHWCYHLVQADVDALVTANRLWDFTRVPHDAGQALVAAVRMAFHDTSSWLPESNGYLPSAEEVNARARCGTGHDEFNQGICVQARCEQEGVPYVCQRCAGSGQVWPSPEIRQKYENWERKGPPTGDGYQLWENVSEGSPISPVFASLDELCAWAAKHATTFAGFRATKEEWRSMLDGGVVHARVGSNIFT